MMLRDGFECIVLTRAGETLTDGTRSSDLPDGMACFEQDDGSWVLMRNHELEDDGQRGAFPNGQAPQAFDARFHGGVSRLVLDPTSLKILSSNTVLTGTHRNCSGGPSPWGWLSCEESEEDNHGYVFRCPTNTTGLAEANIIKGYGRFRHEAVAIDPQSLSAYLTEDQSDGAFYKFTPFNKQRPFEGQLSALRIRDQSHFDTGKEMSPRSSLKVDWVHIADPTAAKVSVRKQAQQQGAAIFVRGEGAWSDENGVVFSATTGGKSGTGQIFRLEFSTNTLTLLAESSDERGFNSPDNITIAPWGDIVIAEDNFLGPNHLFLLDSQGQSVAIGRNEISMSELAGVCFSPDGKVLFCNLQKDGLTVAIRGPWRVLGES